MAQKDMRVFSPSVHHGPMKPPVSFSISMKLISAQTAKRAASQLDRETNCGMNPASKSQAGNYEASTGRSDRDYCSSTRSSTVLLQ